MECVQAPAMTREQFDAMVARLETSATSRPRLYMARVVGLVLLAYGYLALVLLLAFLIVAAVVAMIVFKPNAATIKLGIVFGLIAGGLAWAIVKGLWVRIEPPTGIRLQRAESPELYGMLEELRRQLGSQPFHEVLLTSDYNAAVVQVPRLGALGWHRNYLMLGLPLMQSLGPEEFKAVLAHEFAHLSGGHGRFGNWLYRMRRSWERIFDQMVRQQSGGAWVLNVFVNWYWPKFNAHAFVLSRANEYEADACAARLVGPGAIADALTRIQVHDQLLDDRFWPEHFKRASVQEQAPGDTFQEMNRALVAGAPAPDIARWLRHAFLRETNNADTHPSLTDPLRSIDRLPEGAGQGRSPETFPPTPRASAATVFLGDREADLTGKISEDWRTAVQAGWAQRFEEAQKSLEELKALETTPDAAESAETLWKRAALVLDLEGDRGAVEWIDKLLALEPQHAAANFVRGRSLLETDDARGVEFVERALTEDPTLTFQGFNVMGGHYVRTGQKERIRELEDRLEKHQEVEQLANAERAQLQARDVFEPHELTPGQLEGLVKAVSVEKEVAAVHVARKKVQHLSKNRCFVVCVTIDVSWWSFRSDSDNQKLVARILEQLEMPGYTLVFVGEGELKSFAKKVRAVPDSRIYAAQA